MSYKPNDPYHGEFTTSNPTSQAAQDADSTPVATANHNGTDDAAFVLTVTHIDTGRYTISGTIPVGYSPGDVVNITVAATVASIGGKGRVDVFVLDGKRVSDLNPAVAGDAMALTASERNATADAILTRDWTAIAAGVFPARSILNALRFLRNHWKIAAGTLTVYKEDDTTIAWTKPVVTDANAAAVTEVGP